YKKESFQGCSVVNYTVDEDYTRITEFKYLTGQVNTPETTIVKEYPESYDGSNTPYYSINNPENDGVYAKYKEKADRFKNLYLLGRLAEYKYYNIDAIALRSLELADKLIGQ
ncbi:MAG: UDP-galactopyranose mutase, partial [Lachnospiraceae bacterium]|nr:UDP-galactopyranose mutase [Lachnospiraceae bacterium]